MTSTAQETDPEGSGDAAKHRGLAGSAVLIVYGAA
jgi:hypothetical protein